METYDVDAFYEPNPCGQGPRVFAAGRTRAHWSIENNLHWMLDVIFKEDRCQTRKKHAALNLGVVRKMALGLLKRQSTHMPIKRKTKKASCSNDFLLFVLR